MLLGMLPFLLAELFTVATYGIQRWLSVYNMIDVGTYLLQLAIIVMHVSRIGVDRFVTTLCSWVRKDRLRSGISKAFEAAVAQVMSWPSYHGTVN